MFSPAELRVRNRRRIGLIASWVLLLALVLAACNPEGVAPTQMPTAAPAGTPVPIGGNSKTGVSRTFPLAAGSYLVAWSTTADKAGCAFDLFLTTKANGLTVADFGVSILPNKRDYSGTQTFTLDATGSYVVQEDQSGLLNCRGTWDATITSR